MPSPTIEIDLTEKVAIYGAEGEVLDPPQYEATSDDETVATIGQTGFVPNITLAAVAAGPGTTTVRVKRKSDGKVATGEVTVVDSDPFEISFGTPEPK